MHGFLQDAAVFFFGRTASELHDVRIFVAVCLPVLVAEWLIWRALHRPDMRGVVVLAHFIAAGTLMVGLVAVGNALLITSSHLHRLPAAAAELTPGTASGGCSSPPLPPAPGAHAAPRDGGPG